MLLDAIDKSIEIVLAAVKIATDSPITTFYVDHTDAGGTPGSSDTTTNGVTAVTAVAAPAADTERQVKMITVYNAEQVNIVVYTQLNHGGTTRIMNCSTLAAGESLIYQNEIGFRIATPTGIFFCDVTDRVGRLVGRTSFYDILVNGIIDAAAESIEIDCSGLGSIGIHIVDSGGAWAGALEFDGTIDGTNWVQIRAVQFGGTLVGGTIVNGLFFAQAGGLLKFRVYATAWTSGACAVWLEGTTATNAVTLANSLPTGSNTIGAVTTDALKAANLNIDPAEKALDVGIIDAAIRLLLNSNLAKLQVDPQGRMLVRIDVAGTSTPVTTATHAVTVASGGIAANAFAVGAVRAGAFAAGAITDLPYTGSDHEGYLSQMAFNGIRDRMEFTS